MGPGRTVLGEAVEPGRWRVVGGLDRLGEDAPHQVELVVLRHEGGDEDEVLAAPALLGVDHGGLDVRGVVLGAHAVRVDEDDRVLHVDRFAHSAAPARGRFAGSVGVSRLLNDEGLELRMQRGVAVLDAQRRPRGHAVAGGWRAGAARGAPAV